MSKKKIATRGTLEAPYPVQSGGMVYRVKWRDGEGPLTITDTAGVLAEGAHVRLINGRVTAQDGAFIT